MIKRITYYNYYLLLVLMQLYSHVDYIMTKMYYNNKYIIIELIIQRCVWYLKI